jgi:nitrite reductase/ring-hydroxylating ferredoxin subunit
MVEPQFQVVARASDVEKGKFVRVERDGSDVLICHTAEGFFAIENRCSHAESRLDPGRMRGHRIFCPLHSAAFDVRDGSALSRPAIHPIRSFPVRVDGDNVLIAISR